ncbi:MAG: hypothetical protein CL529_10280 [Aequorivita sp.]|nr:hypothetical protein [Aequorivita sp.]|tara:strand:- start:26897 stop:27568 length:672 start_codon:yes stop_codon:yes gene_type:complete
MNLEKDLLKRIEFVLSNAKVVSDSGQMNSYGGIEVDYSKMKGFRTSAQSLILDLFGTEHPYYTEFKNVTRDSYGSNVNSGIAIINNIKTEIENGWLTSIKGIVSAEIFTDFLEMAEHLLETDYKDPAAVMIGSVLEEHLRQLCLKNSIDIEYEKDGKLIPFKADRLNSELAKAGIYNKLDQKNITAQLDLRNNAAHGKYTEYDKSQVKLMFDFVFNFMTRHQL